MRRSTNEVRDVSRDDRVPDVYVWRTSSFRVSIIVLVEHLSTIPLHRGSASSLRDTVL